jgi:hypothetical protein
VPWQIDVTADDPTGRFPFLNPAGPLVFGSSQVCRPAAGNGNAIGVITTPITAWRLTTNGAGAVYATAVEMGIG